VKQEKKNGEKNLKKREKNIGEKRKKMPSTRSEKG